MSFEKEFAAKLGEAQSSAKSGTKNCLSAEALAKAEENPVRPGRIFALRIFRLGWLL